MVFAFDCSAVGPSTVGVVGSGLSRVGFQRRVVPRRDLFAAEFDLWLNAAALAGADSSDAQPPDCAIVRAVLAGRRKTQ